MAHKWLTIFDFKIIFLKANIIFADEKIDLQIFSVIKNTEMVKRWKKLSDSKNI